MRKKVDQDCYDAGVRISESKNGDGHGVEALDVGEKVTNGCLLFSFRRGNREAGALTTST